MATTEENLSKAEGYQLVSIGFSVYRELGPGYLEDVYQEAMELELTSRKIPFIPKPRLLLHYKGMQLRKHYEADLLVRSAIIVELKAVRAIAPEHEAQLLNELKATRLRVGYLLNFGSTPQLQWLRRVDSSIPIV